MDVARGAAVVLLSVAALLPLAGCTDGSQTAAPATSTTPSDAATLDDDVPGSGEPGDSDQGLTVEQAQTALDETVAAMDDAASIDFTSEAIQVVNGDTSETAATGTWVPEPLAWTSTTTTDGPRLSETRQLTVQEIRQVYVDGRLYSRVSVEGEYRTPWTVGSPFVGGQGGKNRDDFGSPTAIRLVSLIEATGASELGGSLTIAGTVSTSLALKALALDGRLDELGLDGEFEGTNTRVLLTIASDGLPRTLTLEGAGIDASDADLPDYVREELAQARYFATYDMPKISKPIRAPARPFIP